MSTIKSWPKVLVLLVPMATVIALDGASADVWSLASLQGSDRVGADLLEVLTLQPRARVMVFFGSPATADGAGETTPADLRPTPDQVSREILAQLPPAEFQLQRSFRAVEAFAGDVTAEGLFTLLADPRVRRVDLDAGGVGQLAEAGPLTEIDSFQALGFSGQGVTVAVLDSGYDTNHPDLSDDLVAERCFCSDSGAGCCPDGSTTQSGPGSAEDDHGHGTNVSGIVTSKGVVAPAGGAPDAGVVAIKVLDAGNSFCCSSDVVAGLDWILSDRPDVDLVNMSLGTFALFSGECDDETSFTMAFASAIASLRARGVAVFASTGNAGNKTSIAAPACVGDTIAVGAVWDANLGSQSFLGCTDSTTAPDKVTCFSNSNSTTDLFAPGAYTTSSGVGGGTSTFGGTSQASPLAAACAALLLEKAPRTGPDRLEERLKDSPTSVVDSGNGLSFPRLDCYDAGVPCTGPATIDLDTQQTVMGTNEETACERIEAGSYPIGSTGDVTFNAGRTIVLRDGFSVASGGSFRAVVDALLLPPP